MTDDIVLHYDDDQAWENVRKLTRGKPVVPGIRRAADADRRPVDELRTIVARLELLSSAPTQSFDSSGGHSCEHPGGKRPGGDNCTAADYYRRRAQGVSDALERKLDSAVDEDAVERAHLWARGRLENIRDAAADELAQLTGRNGEAPKRLVTKMDRDMRAVVEEDAPGKPADYIAERFGVSKFVVRRWYVEWQLDPADGEPLGEADGWREMAAEMADRLSERQIVAVLHSRGFAVERASVRRAIGRLKVAA